MESQVQEIQEKKDSCVMCGEPTEYSRSTPINLRLYYIEGAGQLCMVCHEKIYGSSRCVCR